MRSRWNLLAMMVRTLQRCGRIPHLSSLNWSFVSRSYVCVISKPCHVMQIKTARLQWRFSAIAWHLVTLLTRYTRLCLNLAWPRSTVRQTASTTASTLLLLLPVRYMRQAAIHSRRCRRHEFFQGTVLLTHFLRVKIARMRVWLCTQRSGQASCIVYILSFLCKYHDFVRIFRPLLIILNPSLVCQKNWLYFSTGWTHHENFHSIRNGWLTWYLLHQARWKRKFVAGL